MTGTWWVCRTCGNPSYDSQGTYAHRQNAGHDDHALATPSIPPGPGSTDAGRKAARRIFEEARRAKEMTA